MSRREIHLERNLLPDRDRRTKTEKEWWNNYALVKDIYQKHGCLPKSSNQKLSSWVQNARKSWENGCLTSEQIKACKEVGLTLAGIGQGKKSAIKSGSKRDRLFALHEKFTSAAINDENPAMTDEENREYIRLKNNARARFNLGQVSLKTAQKLGIA